MICTLYQILSDHKCMVIRLPVSRTQTTCKRFTGEKFGSTVELSSSHYPRTQETETLCVTLGWRSAPVP